MGVSLTMPMAADGTFSRVWAYVDQFAAGDDATRAAMDIAINDVVT